MDISTQGEGFKGTLKGNFPGLQLNSVKRPEIQKLCREIFEDNRITSISGLAAFRNDKEKSMKQYVQGLEHLAESLQGSSYTILVIADPVQPDALNEAKQGYETLYSQLFPFLRTTLSFNETESMNITETHTKGFSDTVGESTSMTQNYSHTNGWNKSSSKGESNTKDSGRALGAVAGGIVGAGLSILTGGMAAPIVAAAAMAGGTIGSGVIGSKGNSYTENWSENGSETKGSGLTAGSMKSQTKQESDSSSQAEGQSHGRTMQFSSENRVIKDLLQKIDKNMERIEKCEAYGAFNCAAYVISSDSQVNEIAANGYNALVKGDTSFLQSSYINSWSGTEQEGKKIKEYLKCFSHPLFCCNGRDDVIVTPASLENSYEVAVGMVLPKKSINGVSVLETAAFGRNIFRLSDKRESEEKIHIGQVYHMGDVIDSSSLDLDVKSLAMHTFVTGSTGSGKSNTVYQMLHELNGRRIQFLVVEPAKGEYKHVFGNDDVNVYGTNPEYTPLLRINPFRQYVMTSNL